MTTATETAPAEAQTTTPLYVRTIADALEKHLEAANTSVHWAQAAGDETPWGAPKLTWPDDACIGYLIHDGNNEGTILKIVHRPDLYGREAVIPLITVKFLRCMKSVFQECVHAMEFINQMDTQGMLAKQMAAPKRYGI